MSSDDGIDYYKSFKLHHSLRHQKTPKHQPSSTTSAALVPPPVVSTAASKPTTTHQKQAHSHKQKNQHSQTGQYQSMSSISSSSSAVVPGTQSQCSTIQRRKLSVNYQHQLQITGECTLNDCPMVNGATNSPNRFSLSLQPHYDDQMMCCLPPPSPAPASDRYVMGIPCPSAIPPPQIPQTVTGSGAVISTSSSTISSSNSSYKFGSNSSSSLSSMNSSSLHRTMSPNSRLRMSDRFRSDAGTPSYNSNYINSTVHTPIKRYVPTPPPPNEMYPIEQTAVIPAHHHSSTSSASSTSGYQTGGSAVNPHVNTLPYRLRMKCCMNEQTTMNANVGTVTDHYATPPRMRPMNKCQAQQVKNQKPDQARTPSMENIVGDSYAASATACLHCNTMRRTTGVHQTTQTTGPISPVPQNLTAPSMPNESSVLTTPSTSNSHISPLSPQINLQQQQQNEIIQQQMIQQREQQQRQQAFQQQVAAANRHHQHQLNLMNQQNAAVVAATNYNTVHTTNQIQISAPAVTPQRSRQTAAAAPNNAVQTQRFTPAVSRKQKVKEYIRREIAKFFGVDAQTETEERYKWSERQKRFAIRRFGPLKNDMDNSNEQNDPSEHPTDRPDILPIADHLGNATSEIIIDSDAYVRLPIEKKASVPTMFISGITYIINTLNKPNNAHHAVGARACHAYKQQWSRSFAPAHVTTYNSGDGDNPGDIYEGLTVLQEEEVFFDYSVNENGSTAHPNRQVTRQMYMTGERVHGWRTSAIIDQQNMQQHQPNAQQHHQSAGSGMGLQRNASSSSAGTSASYRGTRISSQLLDGVLENSRRPTPNKIKLFHVHELDDRHDHRPFFTYWINTVQILVLLLSLISYGVGPIGFGVQQKNGQVLVTSLSLQTVEHKEPRNFWVGPKSNDLVHLGAKFAACMRRDIKIMDVISKTKRQERETACCIRNDDSGCVQSSQADCSVRGLWPTKSISTWKKWSPGESGPGGRISGSVCGLDPKFCDSPASIAPYEWPDDITKWPICRKTNQFPQRFRFKDHTAEHMVCEVIGHPCCTGVYGECRITTKEYCDFVNGYFHEEASLCSQISCLNNVCGMLPFLSVEMPDQFYRLFTSLCLHAGIVHLVITIAIQHVYLADLERLIGPMRTAIIYIGSGVAGTLTSAILVPYKPEVGPLASLAGVMASHLILLLLIHWKQLRKPHVALFKLICMGAVLFGMGTLPWQQNFAGLIAAMICGIFLTVALVPFVSLAKYGRKAKINLIWTCFLFHFLIFTIMFTIFMVFPTELTTFNFGDVFNGVGGGNPDFGQTQHRGGNNVVRDNHHFQRGDRTPIIKNKDPLQPQQGINHHHPIDDIVTAGGGSISNIGDFISNRRMKNSGGIVGGSNSVGGGGHSLVSEISRSGDTITYNTNYVLRQHNNSINSKLPHNNNNNNNKQQQQQQQQQQQSKLNKKVRFQTLIDNIFNKNGNIDDGHQRWSSDGSENLTAAASVSTQNEDDENDDEDDEMIGEMLTSSGIQNINTKESSSRNEGDVDQTMQIPSNNGFNSINKMNIGNSLNSNLKVFGSLLSSSAVAAVPAA